MARTSDDRVILLAEDREDDALLMRKAFTASDITHRLQVVRDGEEAVEYLHGVGPYADRFANPLPQLLLLDLKLPRLSGFDVLQWIRSQPGLYLLRVLILTASRKPEDREICLRLGANSFLQKPDDFVSLVKVTKDIKSYWLETDRAPQVFRPS